ncbi:MAG: creatininase family protein, partial [Acidobacteria bacterium]|nr:creatininase family protein [Acidobacteriota bacterium]
ELAEAIVARPGWKVLVFPAIPLGSGGANEIGRKYSFPGTFAVRQATLRAVYMDFAAELGEQGFRWVFLVHGHGGAPSNNRALLDASDFYHDVYGHTMVHLCGLAPVTQAVMGGQKLWNEEAQRENGLFVHSEMAETSWMLYLRPTAVRSTYAAAPSRTAPTMNDIVRFAEQSDWQGYFGAPRLGTPSHGARALQEYARAVTKLALDILDGADARSIARFADAMKNVPENVQIDAAAAAHDAELERRQREWLSKRDR